MQTKFQIIGTLRGSLWWGGDAEKDVNYTVMDGSHFLDGQRETLRDAVLRVTNDGDFQNCSLLGNSFLKVTMQGKTRTVTRIFDLSLFPSVQDCIIEDFPMFDGEF